MAVNYTDLGKVSTGCEISRPDSRTHHPLCQWRQFQPAAKSAVRTATPARPFQGFECFNRLRNQPSGQPTLPGPAWLLAFRAEIGASAAWQPPDPPRQPL